MPSPPSVRNWSGIGMLPADMAIRSVPPEPDPSDAADPDPGALPRTARENQRLLRLPNFPGPDNGILEQYAEAFRRACT